MNEKIKIISDGKTAQVFIDGKKVNCTDMELHFIAHAKQSPMIKVDARWHKTDENGNAILNEDKTAILTEGIKINCWGGEILKISEMNNCIEKMRECYRFKDNETEIRLVNAISHDDKCVYISTRDENGTKIEMTRYVDELVNV